jgi:outer membrane lipoprotein-sorting protein
MLRPALAFALALAAVAPAHAGPKEELHNTFVKFLAQTSFRGTATSTMAGKTTTSTVEFVAPDSYRVTTAGRPPSLIINGTMYLDVGGRAMKIPMGKETIAQYRNAAMLAEIEKGLQIDDLGLDPVGGQPAHKYRYTVSQPHPSTSTIWVSTKTGLPAQIRTAGKAVDTTITYDHYNDPSIKIVAPK